MSSDRELDAMVGNRVALRQRVGELAGRPLFSDAVGELVRDVDGLVVQTRRGPVRVDRPQVVAVRVVPPAPPRRASLTAITRLEALCADAWPALVDEPLGRWRLRAADGFTGRANAALVLGDPGMPIPAALDAVRAFAQRHAIAPRVHVPAGSPWDRAIAEVGWVLDGGHAAGAEVDVLVGELDAVAALPVPEPVTITDTPPTGWWRTPPSTAERHVVTGSPGTAFATTPHGRVRVCVVEDHLHVALLHVDDAGRGRGVATGLLAATAAWGRERGARWGVLQVAVQNTAAHALYARIGAVRHHGYRYLVAGA